MSTRANFRHTFPSAIPLENLCRVPKMRPRGVLSRCRLPIPPYFSGGPVRPLDDYAYQWGILWYGYPLSCTDTGPLEQSHRLEWGKEQRHQSAFTGAATTILRGEWPKTPEPYPLTTRSAKSWAASDRKVEASRQIKSVML